MTLEIAPNPTTKFGYIGRAHNDDGYGYEWRLINYYASCNTLIINADTSANFEEEYALVQSICDGKAKI